MGNTHPIKDVKCAHVTWNRSNNHKYCDANAYFPFDDPYYCLDHTTSVSSWIYRGADFSPREKMLNELPSKLADIERSIAELQAKIADNSSSK